LLTVHAVKYWRTGRMEFPGVRRRDLREVAFWAVFPTEGSGKAARLQKQQKQAILFASITD